MYYSWPTFENLFKKLLQQTKLCINIENFRVMSTTAIEHKIKFQIIGINLNIFNLREIYVKS